MVNQYFPEVVKAYFGKSTYTQLPGAYEARLAKNNSLTQQPRNKSYVHEAHNVQS